MHLQLFQADAFTDQLFGGNPAAVCPLEQWIPESTMQNIAAENNLAETAFFVPEQDGYGLRWFTPAVEIELCGHATLASAHILWEQLGADGNEIHFYTKSGKLSVRRDGDTLTLVFPATSYKKIDLPEGLANALGKTPAEVYSSTTKWMAVFNSQHNIEQIEPDFGLMSKLDTLGIIITAKGDTVDFVSRFFTPRQGVNEDPVTGSAHTLLIPYWAGQLNKNSLKAMQLSKRQGNLLCKYMGKTVEISGKAVTYLKGEITVS